MTSIKRLLRETSYKILGKMGASRSGSHSLDISAGAGEQVISSGGDNSRNRNKLSASSGKRTRQLKSMKSKSKQSSSAIPEALLIASKNYLPPVQFHHVHGPNVQLHKNKFVARRTQSFCQALVFSNRVILPNERVYIKVLEIAKGWSGTIRFGFTSVDPVTLRYQMPKHACPDMTNAGHTWARALADEVIKRNSVIHFSYNTNGFIHYGINNQDCGIFHANVNTNQNLWFIVDIYGLTAAVELIDPRIHNHHHATSDLDISLDEGGFSSTMFKSTSAMDELLSQHIALRAKKKRSRKSNTRQAMELAQLYHQHRHHLPEGVILPPGSIGYTAAAAHHQGPLLPNLSSVMLPSAQQNIYSPMPMINNRPEHDYYQIMTNQATPNNRAQRQADPRHNSSLISTQADSSLTSSSSSAARMMHSSAFNSSPISAAAAEAANSSTTGRRGARRRVASATVDEQAEICQQLSSLQMNQSDNVAQTSAAAAVNTTTTSTRQHQQYSAFKASSSSANKPSGSSSSSHHPVAAARRRLQSSIEPNKADRSSSGAAQVASSSSSTLKAKARQSVKSSAPATKSSSTAASGRENNSPQSKDCPICFERPINCVLYQCGHMCTCYECGVKQWRTQQRTCPICRTIIKDVIKTYMS